jgi:hypothetical protein
MAPDGVRGEAVVHHTSVMLITSFTSIYYLLQLAATHLQTTIWLDHPGWIILAGSYYVTAIHSIHRMNLLFVSKLTHAPGCSTVLQY